MFRSASICLFLICVVGCTHRSKRGDATLELNTGTIVAAPAYTLRLPPVALTKQHTKRFEVRNLPVAILPNMWRFPASEQDTHLDVPLPPGSTDWADAVIELAIHEPDGPALYTTRNRLGDLAGVSWSLGWGIERLGGFFPVDEDHELLRQLMSYDAVISVKQPVRRSRPLVITGYGETP